ncbi:MAG: GNAT family N-acetyltransferase [Bacillota bacterium]
MSLPTDIMLRPARLQDIPEIARISAGIWDGEDYVPRVAAGWISDPSGRFVAAEHEGIVRGFGRIVMHTATDAWAEGLRVDPSFRRHGVARAIVRHLLDQARTLGARRLRFSTSIQNIESIALNESLGFRKIAGLRFFDCDRDQFPSVVARITARAGQMTAGRQIRIRRVCSWEPNDPFILAVRNSKTVAGAGGMLPSGFVFYPGEPGCILQMADRGCGFEARGCANAPFPDAVLLMDAATESQPDDGDYVISVLEGEPASCWALLSAAFDAMSGAGMKSACACVPCNSTAAAILEEAGFETWPGDVPAESPAILLYEYLLS